MTPRRPVCDECSGAGGWYTAANGDHYLSVCVEAGAYPETWRLCPACGGSGREPEEATMVTADRLKPGLTWAELVALFPGSILGSEKPRVNGTVRLILRHNGDAIYTRNVAKQKVTRTPKAGGGPRLMPETAADALARFSAERVPPGVLEHIALKLKAAEPPTVGEGEGI